MTDEGHDWALVEPLPKKDGWLCLQCGATTWTKPHETPNPHIKVKGILPDDGGAVEMFTCKESIAYDTMKQ